MTSTQPSARKINTSQDETTTMSVVPNSREVIVELGSADGDQLRLELRVQRSQVNGSAVDEIASANLTGVGCTELLKAMNEMRSRLCGPLAQIVLPQGSSHVALMMRELILKARGEWKFPYQEEELCHCRAVATAKVDAAIIAGCHTGKSVARETSAGTSCGTCLRDTQAIIDYRLKNI